MASFPVGRSGGDRVDVAVAATISEPYTSRCQCIGAIKRQDFSLYTAAAGQCHKCTAISKTSPQIPLRAEPIASFGKNDPQHDSL